MRSPMSLLRPRLQRTSAAASAWLQQRATLEGLEVRDSTWDEWLAAEQAAMLQREAVLLESGTGPMRRLMQQ